MVTVTVSYPLDPTGTSPANLVQGEVHPLTSGRKVQAFAVGAGAFYVNSLVVVHEATQRVLTKGVEYYSANLIEVPTSRYGQDVCSIVILKNPNLGGNLLLTYQAVGGGYNEVAGSVVRVLNSINVNQRSSAWPFVMPDPAVRPAGENLYDAASNDVYGFEYCVLVLDRLARTIEQGDVVARDVVYDYIDAMSDRVDALLADRARVAMYYAMLRHLQAFDPHSQYFLKGDISSVAGVRTPTNVSPADGATNQSRDIVLTGDTFRALYRYAQQASHFQISTSNDFSGTLVLDHVVPGVGVTYSDPDALAPSTTYYWRVRYQNELGVWSVFSSPTSFTIEAAGVLTPSVVKPVNNAVGIGAMPILTATAFATVGQSDTHQSTDWEIWTGPNGSGTLVWSSEADAVNLTQLMVPAGSLQVNRRYYPRVRFRGAALGISAWSDIVSFTTAASFAPTAIGDYYQGGYFVGNIQVGAEIYAVLMAPKASGETSLVFVSPKQNEDTWYSPNDSVANTDALVRQSSAAGSWARGLTIDGFGGWQVPAREVLELMYRNAKPDASANNTATGSNADSIPAGSNYASGDPTAATAAAFITGGVAALVLGGEYWSSTGVAASSQTTTVTNPDVPIYGTQTTQNPHGSQTDSTYSNYAAGGAFSPTCADTPNSSGPTDVVDQSWVNGDGSTTYMVSWNCPVTAVVVTGYQSGGSTTTTNYYYPAYSRHMDDGSEATPDRDQMRYVRAVRLVKVS